MKLCIISDLHSARPQLTAIIKKNINLVDLFIFCGDITDYNIDPDPFLKYIPKNKFLFVPGNCDSLNKLEKYKDNNIDRKIVEMNGFKFCGLGGALKTEFNRDRSDQYLWNENEIKDILNKFPERCILVTHSPPKYLLDKTFQGKHHGSKEILKFVKYKQPMFVFCGHIHESRGLLKYKETIILNPGNYGNYYAIVDLETNKINILKNDSIYPTTTLINKYLFFQK